MTFFAIRSERENCVKYSVRNPVLGEVAGDVDQADGGELHVYFIQSGLMGRPLLARYSQMALRVSISSWWPA